MNQPLIMIWLGRLAILVFSFTKNSKNFLVLCVYGSSALYDLVPKHFYSTNIEVAQYKEWVLFLFLLYNKGNKGGSLRECVYKISKYLALKKMIINILSTNVLSFSIFRLQWFNLTIKPMKKTPVFSSNKEKAKEQNFGMKKFQTTFKVQGHIMNPISCYVLSLFILLLFCCFESKLRLC